jgi:hypothetical protein
VSKSSESFESRPVVPHTINTRHVAVMWTYWIECA